MPLGNSLRQPAHQNTELQCMPDSCSCSELRETSERRLLFAVPISFSDTNLLYASLKLLVYNDKSVGVA